MWLHSSVGRESHRYRGGHEFESRWSPDLFFRLLLSNCLNWKINCNDHSSLSSTIVVQIYELFHIYFSSFHSSREIWTQKNWPRSQCVASQLSWWSIAPVSRRSRVRIPLKPWFLFRLLPSNCLNWKIYCDDHSSLSSTTAVQIWIISYKLDIISLQGKIWTQ